ncbi:hypothetical protein CRM22_001753 [Opisthorchis felineus]|uniref:Kinesin-like protein n=1 Tax=Opisthorchis felineus TaxID=147828 RepID=A0A4S2M960_OPIFE|nr:hypothetical protein CRM22_001753 [Opisthorchis felineus]
MAQDYDQDSQTVGQESSCGRQNSSQSWEEDRVEFVNIPARGKLQTQIFETRTRVHCYFDPEEATWLRLPIAWELYSPAARHLVNLVKDVCPGWGDDADILAALRVSNYNVDDCVNTYHSSVGRENSFSVQGASTSRMGSSPIPRQISFTHDRTSPENGDKGLIQITNEVESLQQQLADVLIELSREKSNNEQLRLMLQRKESAEHASNTIQLQFGHTVQHVRGYCQEVRDMLHGTKHFVQDFVKTVASLVKRAHSMHMEQTKKLVETRALYRLEAQQRRLTYNTLIELRGNIRVFCRIRPIDCDSSRRCWLQTTEAGELVAHLTNSNARRFQFDHIFHVEATQEQVFGELSDIIASSVDGYNVCIMAYGQTGSGKTYTMEGPPDKPGVNILSIRELLRIVHQRHKVDFQLTMSILEIYNENVVDLLSPANSCESVEIRHSNQSVSIVGATWVPVKDEVDMHNAISMGQRGRHVAETKLNSSSSRSHLIVSVCVVGTDRISGAVSRGQLTLCDLAGSERIEKSGVTSGERFQEATYINRSLSALAQVFVALRNNQLHIPYRNTKLTQMLQPCLGGDSKTCLIVNVTTDRNSVSETMSTLQFGTNARQVALGPAKAHVMNVGS